MLEEFKESRDLEMRHDGQSISAPMGLAKLGKLQVLTGLQASAATVHEISSLIKLQKLSIEDLNNEDAEKLCSSVNNLSYLSIFSGDGTQPLDIATLKPSSCLQKLHIAGSLQTLPDWFAQLHNLTKLRLSLSKLEEDSLSVLTQLPNLLFLQLNKAYQEK